MSKTVTVDLNEWEKFRDEHVESLDCSDHFDSGFSVAMSIANNWLHEKALEQPNTPRIFCHVCGAEMDYVEDFESTFKRGEEYIFVDRIRAHVCLNCHEVVYSSKEAKRIEDIVLKRNILDI